MRGRDESESGLFDFLFWSQFDFNTLGISQPQRDSTIDRPREAWDFNHVGVPLPVAPPRLTKIDVTLNPARRILSALALFSTAKIRQFFIVRFSSGKHLSHEGMANDNQYTTEIARLQRTAAESRLRVVESQLALAFTLCAIAETEIRYSRPDEAIKVVNKIRHHVETISFHIGEPNHLPSTAISDLRKKLTQLKKRTEEVESCLRQR